MRRRNWIMAAMLCAGILLAMAQSARAEPDTEPVEPVVATEATTVRTRSTYEWEAITDQYGVTVHPPPPDEGGPPPDDGPTTTTVRTSRTTAPFRINPDHPEDVDSRDTPWIALPHFTQVVTDIYGNEITVVVTEPPTTETTAEETSEETTEEFFAENPAIPVRPFNWAVAATAGGLLLAAGAGVSVVLAKNRKDGGGEDDYIYEEEPAEE